MFCVASFITFPGSIDPELEDIVLFETREEAVAYANAKLVETNGKYGGNWLDYASMHRHIATYMNGSVTWRAYVSPVDMPAPIPSTSEVGQTA